LVFWFVSKRIKRKDLAFIVSLFFAVHPMFLEAIAWVSARSTLLFASFYLSAIISYLYFLEGKKKKFIILTFLFFLGSLLCKVMAITPPMLLVVFDFYYKRVLIEKLPFFTISFIFGIVSIYGRQIEGHLGGIFTFFDKLFVKPYQLVWYILSFAYH
jgi:hypothetical protein